VILDCGLRIADCGRAAGALVLAAVLAGGCSKSSDQPHTLRFAFIPKAVHIPVFNYARIGAERAAKQMGGVEIIWRGPESTDEIRQKELLESFIAQHVDGIAISCLNGDLLTDAIDRAVDAGIPVVTWDSDAPRSKRQAFYGVNDVEAGRALGDGLAKLLHNRGRVAIITSLGADNLQKRLDGAKDVLETYPDIQIVEVFDATTRCASPRSSRRRRSAIRISTAGCRSAAGRCSCATPSTQSIPHAPKSSPSIRFHPRLICCGRVKCSCSSARSISAGARSR